MCCVLSMCIYIYIYIHTYIHTYIHIYIYIYVYIYREREGDVYIYIYIYVYMLFNVKSGEWKPCWQKHVGRLLHCRIEKINVKDLFMCFVMGIVRDPQMMLSASLRKPGFGNGGCSAIKTMLINNVCTGEFHLLVFQLAGEWVEKVP